MALPLIAVQTAIVMSVAIVLAVLSVGLRLWSRSLTRMPLVFSDYAILVAMVVTMGVYWNAMIGIFLNTIGVHMQDLLATRPWVIVPYLKSFTAAEVLWAAANTCVKLSILTLYMNLFPSKAISRICKALMTVAVIYLMVNTVDSFVLCQPVDYNWNKSIPGGSCNGQSKAFLAMATTNLIIDVCIVILPMPMVFGLQMSLSKRFGIAGMFSLGALICIISLLRIIWVVRLDLEDVTYGVGSGTIYSALEPILGVVNACLPTMKPALVRIFRVQPPSWTKRTISLGYKASGADKKKLDTGNSGTGSARPLDDNIPLTRVFVQSNDSNLDRGQSITVTHEWQVNSSPQVNNHTSMHW
ncbi:hypothetical protein F4780DRAFT_751397 [Xylariomycetidae sp. FL0641]|nr:hypothetical protein F4780DRAFT_751397 [Xylariomycetidae sp. FL0641]